MALSNNDRNDIPVTPRDSETYVAETQSTSTRVPPSTFNPPLPKKSSNTAGVLTSAALISLLVGGASGATTFYALSKSSNNGSSIFTRTVTGKTENVNITNEDSPITELSKKSVDSVVSIVASKVVTTSSSNNGLFGDFFNNLRGNPNAGPATPNTEQQISAGTGFVVTSDGYIITNRHVVEDTTANYTVIFNNGIEVKGTVIDRDTVLDIAFVKVDPSDKVKLIPLALGTSSSVVVGQTSVAIGNSLGEFSNTVSKGIISGLNRNIQAGDTEGGNIETLSNIIQTDASINSGNSGGPLLDISGNVIGINVAKASGGENIGFAIPIDTVKPILDSVIKNGKIIRPYIGVRYIDVTSAIATARGLSKNYGVLVEGSSNANAVVAGSPADKAGIKAGDQILSVNGEKISPEVSLRTLLTKYAVGDTVTLNIINSTNERDVKVTLQAAPKVTN